MLEQIILGIIQGIAEWLPVSSEGLIVLTKTHFFPSDAGLESLVKEALFLHLGTVCAAGFYFRCEILRLIRCVRHYPTALQEDKNILKFLVLTTIFSGILGLLLLKSLARWEQAVMMSGKWTTLLVGCCLMGTALLELRANSPGYRTARDINRADTFLLGVAQGCAALPGFSRSGLTMSALLLKKVEKATALKLSFLMSIPIVLAGNVVLNFTEFTFRPELFAGFLASFIFGLLTIHALLKLAQKINFGYFVGIFGLLVLASSFLIS